MVVLTFNSSVHWDGGGAGGGRVGVGTSESLTSRPAWYIQGVPGQPGLHCKILCKKQNLKQQNKQTKNSRQGKQCLKNDC